VADLVKYQPLEKCNAQIFDHQYWSDVDQMFIAEVPELPGCMAHGDSPADALDNAMQAIELWIATAEEFGDPVPQPKGERLMYA